jgi:hypothetical protein
MKTVIYDWAGNLMEFGTFKDFEDAEEFLSEKLGDDYETDRGEYVIDADRGQRETRYLDSNDVRNGKVRK